MTNAKLNLAALVLTASTVDRGLHLGQAYLGCSYTFVKATYKMGMMAKVIVGVNNKRL